jgi:hypothetical protein
VHNGVIAQLDQFPLSPLGHVDYARRERLLNLKRIRGVRVAPQSFPSFIKGAAHNFRQFWIEDSKVWLHDSSETRSRPISILHVLGPAGCPSLVPFRGYALASSREDTKNMSETPDKVATKATRGTAFRQRAETQYRILERRRRLAAASITKTDTELIAEALARGRVSFCPEGG